jgi:hypothetical protein
VVPITSEEEEMAGGEEMKDEKEKSYVKSYPAYPTEYRWTCPYCEGITYTFLDTGNEEEECFYCEKMSKVKPYWKL